MHPLLRTLDLTAGAGAESSVHDLHPIRQSAPPGSRKGPLLLSLSLTSLLIYGLSLSLVNPSSLQQVQRAVDQASRSVSFLLHEPAPPAPGSSGQGHVDGTSSRDPRLAVIRTTLPQPVPVLDPDELGLSPLAERAGPLPDLALPLQAGGNGLARGSSRDAAKGTGRLTRPPSTAPPDLKLVPIHQVTPYHQLARGQEEAARVPVRIRLLIGEDGVPLQATAISGPVFLHAGCIKAALDWRFEPLGAHGLKAPYSQVLIFHPTWVSSR